jgi:NitT/TauT family transport system substrate-binding protein
MKEIKMNIDRRTLLTGVAALGVAATTPAIGQSMQDIKFTLTWIPLGGFAHIFVSKKLGFWERRGLNVTIDRGFGSNEVCKTVGLGQYDFGMIDMAVMMNCRAKQLDLSAIGIISPHSPVGIFSLAKTGIKTPKDLEGKKLSFSSGSGDYLLWPAFVKSSGIDDTKVEKVFTDPASHLKLLLEGKVDGIGNYYASVAPTVWAQGVELNVMLYESYGLPMYSLAFTTRSKTVAENPDLCSRFVDGAMEGLAYTFLHPEESAKIHLDMVKEYQGVPSNIEAIKYGVLVNNAMGIAPELETHGLGYMGAEMIGRTRQTVIDYLGVANLPAGEQMITNQFAGRIKLTDAEWQQARQIAAPYIPKKSN